METFQDLSLPIPGKEDLAKLHSAIYQNVPAKPGACGDSYAAQGWLAFIVEYIRRCAHLATTGQHGLGLVLVFLGGRHYTVKSTHLGDQGGPGRIWELQRSWLNKQGISWLLWSGQDWMVPWSWRAVTAGR